MDDNTKPLFEGGPAIMLVRPQLAVNIGMCARAMANFGLSDLRLVSPREGWPRTGASGRAPMPPPPAPCICWNTPRFSRVAAAVADLNFVWAATARERGQQKRVKFPRSPWRKPPRDACRRKARHHVRAGAHGP